MNASGTFLEQLQRGPLLCDGGMGSELHIRGVSHEHCFEQLNLSSPELIKGIHLDYIAAGAQVIETNTFGANRYRLAEHGLEHVVREINRAGAKVAREARELSDAAVFLAGSIGPLGSPLAPLGTITAAAAYEAFLEQAEALLQAGVDLFLLETFSDMAEISAALAAVRSVTDLPVVAQMTFADDGLVASGEDPLLVARTLKERGANVVGVNCALGPSSMFEIIKAMCAGAPEQLLVSAQPNAGLPRRVGNRFMYISTPDYFADYTRRFVQAGVRLIGGCCGTTPRHIAAMKQTLLEFAPAAATPAPQLEPSYSRAIIEAEKSADCLERDPASPAPTYLAELLQKKRFVVSVEMLPPRSVKFTRFLQTASAIRESGADVINIPDNATARVRMNNVAAARLIQQHTGMETIAHLTPRDRNLMALQSDVIGAHATDVRNIIAITGDPPAHGDFPDATGIWDVDSIGLIAMMSNLNQGLDARGRKLAASSSFYIGCAANPTATDRDLDLERLHQKIAGGAMFIMTQPVFDVNALLDYLACYRQRYGALSLPILIGLQPLHSYQQAEKFHNEVPGITIPQHVRERLRQAGEQGRKVGIEIAREIFKDLSAVVQGVYIMPFDHLEIVHELLPYIRACTTSTV
ncbi:MAG TPA: bifunctional homocysteine S-methyltransferase/methylenetetrahydrofolate reductase [Ktedonobacteraceae bacterium]|nr:bifunctional homocysteine S-methyltransferase/methylenetetrahydrofolate reductase [Ktedonobacteraceae bacterium]